MPDESNTVNTVQVPCNVCGKLVSPYASYYLTRRSKLLGATHEWEYFAIAPVFYACSFLHFSVAMASWRLGMDQLNDAAMRILPGDSLDL